MTGMFLFGDGETVLLLGEGNFSFTISLLKRYKSTKRDVSVISTCFQPFKTLGQEARQRAREANKLGAEIWFGVDATQTHLHERFKQVLFNGVIFNFPHINGKMKIDRNRQLLKHFFSSASQVLDRTGRVLVTLCQGQSGTPFDVKQRKEEDSWQVITMATYGDLLLKNAIPFVASDWEDYACSGYRGLEKRFHVENSYTFQFYKSPISLEKCYSLSDQHYTEKPHCRYVKTRLSKYSNCNIFAEASAFKEYFEARSSSAIQAFEGISHICQCTRELPLLWEASEFSALPDNCLKCFLVCNCCSQRNFLQQIQKFIVINNESVPAISQYLFHPSGFSEAILDTTNNLRVKVFKCKSGGVTTGALLTNAMGKQILFVNVELFFRAKANFMSPKLCFPSEFNVPILSLHPPVYTHDISMWITAEFSEEKFACCLRNICGDLITDFKFVDSYDCPLNKRTSMCYRLRYQSFQNAFSPQQSFFLHSKVLGPLLERHLHVTIR